MNETGRIGNGYQVRGFGLCRPASPSAKREGLAVARSAEAGASAGQGLATNGDGTLMLIDEVLTPDSSRFWPAASYEPGHGQPSFDKQFVRDYLERIKWNKQPPVPSLPDDVVLQTREKYLDAYRQLTGQELQP
jgi:hypothetical protein